MSLTLDSRRVTFNTAQEKTQVIHRIGIWRWVVPGTLLKVPTGRMAAFGFTATGELVPLRT